MLRSAAPAGSAVVTLMIQLVLLLLAVAALVERVGGDAEGSPGGWNLLPTTSGQAYNQSASPLPSTSSSSSSSLSSSSSRFAINESDDGLRRLTGEFYPITTDVKRSDISINFSVS